MKPERVAELAEQCYPGVGFSSTYNEIYHKINQAIATAVAEQIECDAKICKDRKQPAMQAGAIAVKNQWEELDECAQAIRSQHE